MSRPAVREPTTPDGQKSPPLNEIVNMTATAIAPLEDPPCQSPGLGVSSNGQLLGKRGQSSNTRLSPEQGEGQNQQFLPGSRGHSKELDIETFVRHATAEYRTDLGVDVDVEDHPGPTRTEIKQYQEDLKESYKLAPADRKDRKHNRLMDVGEDVDEKLAMAKKQYAQMLAEKKYKKLDPAPQVYFRKSCCSTNCNCSPCWSRHPSCKAEEAALASPSVHVLLRNIPNATGTGWELSEIVIRGQEMKDALGKVFKGYPGFEPRMMGEGDWIFSAPFMPFVHRWSRLAAYPFHWNGEHDIDTTHEVERQYILTSIAWALERPFKEMELIKETGEARFEDLWLLYAPDTIVVTELASVGTTKRRPPEAVRVVSCTPVMSDCNGKTQVEAWQVKSNVHVHNGETMGWCTETWTIPRYQGYRRVDALGPFFPLEYHPHASTIVTQLHSRGKKAFESCCNFGPMWFTARSPVMRVTGDLHEGLSEPRTVMIDVDGFYKYCGTVARPLIHTKSDLLQPKATAEQSESVPTWADSSHGKPGLDTQECWSYDHRGQQDARTAGEADNNDGSKGPRAMRQSSSEGKKSDLSHHTYDSSARGLLHGRLENLSGSDTLLSAEAWFSSESTPHIEGPIIPEFLLSRGYLGGFDLATKQWCRFSATDLEPVHDSRTNMHAIDKLYPGHQHIARIAELVRRKVDPQLNVSNTRASLDNSRRDLKAYLGRALTFLIAGPTGVGKTATVHAIAHMNKTSVWETTVDELCSFTGGFQRALETALHLCERMNFLFLLEDADSLACHDTKCKDHVAVTLQVLNKTPCVVFLTANDFDLIPYNLRSRCDKIVQLPELSRKSRRRAWLKAFKEQGVTQHILNSTQLDTALNLADKPGLNGHEIVNMVKQVPMRAIGGFNCDGDNYVNELGRMMDEVEDAKIGMFFTSSRGDDREMRNGQDSNDRQKENRAPEGKENRYPMLEHEYEADGDVEETDGYEESF